MKNNTTKTNKRALNVIFFIMLMDIIGLSILGPVAPYIVKRYSDSALTVTMLTVIYAGAMFFAAPFMGKISDRIGRRPVLLVSVFGSAIGYFIFGIGGALWVLFSRGCSTASPAVISPPLRLTLQMFPSRKNALKTLP